MATDEDGDYYYDAGTVNELFDDIALVEGDGELEVETPDGVSRLGGLGSVLGGKREAPSGGDLATDESMIFVDSSDNGLKVAHSTDGSDVVLSVIVADVTAST